MKPLLWRVMIAVRKLAAVLLLSLVSLPISAQLGTAKLQTEFDSLLVDKKFLLRDFPQGDLLEYDETGRLVDHLVPGDWTLYGNIEVQAVSILANAIEIRGKRLVVTFPEGRPERRYARSSAVTVRLRRDPMRESQTERALFRVFLTNNDHLSEVVPDYWKYFARQIEQASGAKVPPLALPETMSTGEKIYTSKDGATAPKLLKRTDPVYPPLASDYKVEGKSVLWVVVDKNGAPAYVQIVQPYGFGFDEEAVSAVRKWKFSPGTMNGIAAATAVNVEVNFRQPR